MDTLKATGLTRTKGNTIVEYGLIGMLICLVSIAALFSFSGAFSEKVTELKTDMQARSGSASAQATQIAAMKSLRGQGGVSGDALASDASNFADGGGNAVTTGANGTTLGLTGKTGNGLTDAMSNLSKEEKNLVKEVANTAHKIAQLQAILEDLSKYSNGNMDIFKNAKVMLDGKIMTAYEIAKALGNEGLAAQLEIKKNEVLNSGIKGDVKDTVAELSDKIKDGATTTSDKTNDAIITNADPTSVDNVTDSKQTDKDASDICKASGGKDNGKKCGSNDDDDDDD